MNCFVLLLHPILAQTVQPSPTAGQAQETVLRLIQAGGWVMVPLIGASILTLTLILACFLTLRRGAVVTRRYMDTADALLRKRDYTGLIAVSNRHSSAIARITAHTLDFAIKHPSAPPSAIREVAETEGTRFSSSLNQRIVYLADLATLSPMLGLLGTVVGIINSFGVLAGNTNQPRQVLLAGGVAQALVATAAGLVVGISAMAFYSLFRGKVTSMVSDLEAATTHIVNILATQRSRRTEPSGVLENDDV
ncbi:MAG: MotA/TolQ/ExbB proton channel family protein [Verrucomicrobia bacterium]|nr:MotA/TolQ/ExbB proton channel family protein [Verrucomicrobiota bacterium]MBV9274645.1 MotA/TolQ/ExbB proton channel family protein [Verrucomicrobiota bacterium]